MADPLITSSRRTVEVEQFLLEVFGLGVLAGNPEFVRKALLSELPDRMRLRFPGHAGQLILAPPPDIVYVLAAALVSEPVGADADTSSLVVVWFSSELPIDLAGALEAALYQVDWEAHAVDGRF